jgi:hypothetical protein
MPTFSAPVVAMTPVPQIPVEATPAITWNPMILVPVAVILVVAGIILRLGRKRAE